MNLETENSGKNNMLFRGSVWLVSFSDTPIMSISLSPVSPDNLLYYSPCFAPTSNTLSLIRSRSFLISPAPRERLHGKSTQHMPVTEQPGDVMRWHRRRQFPNKSEEMHHRSSSLTMIHHHVPSFLIGRQSTSHHLCQRMSDVIFVK